MDQAISRRQLLGSVVATAATGVGLPTLSTNQRAGPVEIEVSILPETSNTSGFNPQEFGIVGVYDGDWFSHDNFAKLLDNMAASPRAFHGVRFFGTFTAGAEERYLPEDSGNVWPHTEAPMDFTASYNALAELTSRGLTPFIPFGFFPPAVSRSMLQPPSSWDDYQTLVRSFLEGLAEDSRFGPEAIANWWFEAWNEPNEGRFWSGTVEEYLELYRATSEAIAQTGLSIRFGGPAIAYKPQVSHSDGAPWMERFLRFIASEPHVQCDFISYHRKGTVTDDAPDPRLMYEAGVTTAEQLRKIDLQRFRGISIVNNEADEKVGFENPYAPRLDERNAAWLGTVATIHGGLSVQYADSGFQFIGAADNANLQLVEEPFDGRRSIMTYAQDSETDLLKLPAYAYYEMLVLLGDRPGTVRSGADHLFPITDLYHLTAFSETHGGCLMTRYPDSNDEDQTALALDFTITNIPWDRVNVAHFQIDRELSNAYAASGGSDDNPFPSPALSEIGHIRHSQELAVARPIERNIHLARGEHQVHLKIAPYTTLLIWLTPFEETIPKPPRWNSISIKDGNVVLKWTPILEPNFYSYEVFLMHDGTPGDRLTPFPLRSALWVDTAPEKGSRVYGVRAITASGVASAIAVRDEVVV